MNTRTLVWFSLLQVRKALETRQTVTPAEDYLYLCLSRHFIFLTYGPGTIINQVSRKLIIYSNSMEKKNITTSSKICFQMLSIIWSKLMLTGHEKHPVCGISADSFSFFFFFFLFVKVLCLAKHKHRKHKNKVFPWV